MPHPKFAPVAEPGVFMGYHVLPGGRWRGDFLVASLQEFNTAIANPGRSGKHKIRIQRVKELYIETRRMQLHFLSKSTTIESSEQFIALRPTLSLNLFW